MLREPHGLGLISLGGETCKRGVSTLGGEDVKLGVGGGGECERLAVAIWARTSFCWKPWSMTYWYCPVTGLNCMYSPGCPVSCGAEVGWNCWPYAFICGVKGVDGNCWFCLSPAEFKFMPPNCCAVKFNSCCWS